MMQNDQLKTEDRKYGGPNFNDEVFLSKLDTPVSAMLGAMIINTYFFKVTCNGFFILRLNCVRYSNHCFELENSPALFQLAPV